MSDDGTVCSVVGTPLQRGENTAAAPLEASAGGLNPANTGAAKSLDTGTAKPSEIGHSRKQGLFP